jgi:hypothetical protein
VGFAEENDAGCQNALAKGDFTETAVKKLHSSRRTWRERAMSLRFFCFPDPFCVAEPILQLDDASAVHYRLSFGVRGGFRSRIEDGWVVTMLFHDFPSVE